jgi:hypothetical protein
MKHGSVDAFVPCVFHVRIEAELAPLPEPSGRVDGDDDPGESIASGSRQNRNPA